MTTQNVCTIIRAHVPEGALDELKRLASELSALTAEEPGALTYEWVLSEDERELRVLERFVDSDACMAHLENVGEAAAGLFALVSVVDIECYGAVSEEFRAATQDMPMRFMVDFAGFHRSAPAAP